jgi:hypothetical protein
MLRPTIAALVTVFAVQVAISGQATAPSFTPLPWSATDQPQGVGTPSADPVTAARLQEVLSRLRASQRTPETSEQTRAGQTAERLREAATQLKDQQSAQRALAGASECALPDGTTHRINAKVTYNGWSYLCVEALDANLVRSGVAWMRVAD